VVVDPRMDQNLSSEIAKNKSWNDICWDVCISEDRLANLTSRLCEWKKESRKQQQKGGSEPNKNDGSEPNT
jgi:hypothetical protein